MRRPFGSLRAVPVACCWDSLAAAECAAHTLSVVTRSLPHTESDVGTLTAVVVSLRVRIALC